MKRVKRARSLQELGFLDSGRRFYIVAANDFSSITRGQ
jgi:hypothetical protein